MSSREGKSLGVPKFTSFKSKPEPSQDKSKHHRHDEQSPVRTGSCDRQEHSARGERSRERESRQAGLARHRHKYHESSHGPRSSDVSTSNSFFLDSRGDALIRRYGSNNRYDVPSYRRFGSGRILGADGFLRMERLGNHEEFSIRGYGEGNSALSRDRKSVLAKAGRHNPETVKIRTDKSGTFTGTEDFLPLRNVRHQHSRRKSHSLADENENEAEPNYRDVRGKSKAHEYSDSDEVYESDSSVSLTSSSPDDDPVKQKTVELSARVRDQSQDLSAWLELVDHQDTLLRLNQGDGQHATPAEVKSYADIKLSLLEKALANFKNQHAREKLLLRSMHEGSKIWDPQTISNRWEDLVKDHGDSFEVWRGYVTYRQTSLSTFHYEQIKQLYISRLRKVEARLSTPAASAQNLQAACDELVIVFLRMTRFISDAGYTELATAAWQSMLELSFCRPGGSAEKMAGAVPTSFRDFWESEVPRIGEKAARGWAAFEDVNDTQEPPEPKTSDIIALPATRNTYKAWAASEQHRAAEAKTPARTLDEGAEADPYRVVMYADIQDLLSFVPPPILPMIQVQLLDAFLIFHHLPPAFGTGNAIRSVLQDTLLSIGNAFNLEVSQQTDQSPDEEHADASHDLEDAGHHYQRIAKSLETLFPSSHWFRYIQPIRGDVSSDQYDLILNSLRQLTHLFGQGALATYLLAFEAANETDNAKKVAKALIKRYPLNIELYVGYSITEYSKDDKTAARKVVSAALGLPGIVEHDKLSLSLAWAWLELADGNFLECVARFCLVSGDAVPHGIPASTAQVLKAGQSLQSKRDYLISCGDANHAVSYTIALCLFEYTTGNCGKESKSPQQGDITSALDVISTTSEELSSHGLANSADHERLLQFAAQLLYFHATHGPFRPGLLHGEVAKYIKYFPQNTIFLTLYAWREARLSIEDRVRSILNDVVLVEPHDCVTSRVFAITHEMRAGNAHSTAAAFEHALETEACKHHINLWISYIRFCRSRRELKSKAKSVFYRAIQQCPWSKDVFMEAFVTLVSDMDSSELRSVYNTLCEKGLRIHIELENFVQTWKQAQRPPPRHP